MNKKICDICQENEADVSYKVKKSKRGIFIHSQNGARSKNNSIWSIYEKIDICKQCAEKLINGLQQ